MGGLSERENHFISHGKARYYPTSRRNLWHRDGGH